MYFGHFREKGCLIAMIGNLGGMERVLAQRDSRVVIETT